ncbi:hypothetical protein GWR56_04015 [Mucilaginibacter sp. 14171R-50]|uniref:hypothetical protein n=1 Tax=Mucilaginibacter sp. 14171R-50 TaxID=2703789 RepID=UPI00138C56A2|nr:hypothetical protein [Mucilaginibacter sp. 14171R-50]QHS54750.1 hypothetical protein GWR56_04015 [Mucilaginibacter sp. 14171R-50]
MKVNFKNTPVGNLSNIDPEDVEEVMLMIEKSFNIKFEGDLTHIKTFGALCDLVVDKVKQVQSDSCTTQQAFYKLRSAINAKKSIEKCDLKPQTKLCELFPRDNRIEVIADLESEMGLHMNLLRPKPGIVWAFAIVLILSITISFAYGLIGYIGTVISITGLVLAGKFGKELKVKTLGDLSEKIAREHYLKCRRDASTVNRAEIAEKIRELFADYLAVEPASLRKEARFA